MKILVCNAGSSSLKFSLLEACDESFLAEGSIDWTTKPTSLLFHGAGQEAIREVLKVERHEDAAARIFDDLQAGSNPALARLEELQAVAHRVVHGGPYTAAVQITPEVKRQIEKLAPLAPLHNPATLKVIAAVEEIVPRVAQIAAFDTAFHTTLSRAASVYPVPFAWTRKWGLLRYGFHGLSHSYCATRVAEMLRRQDLRIIISHLGNGASISAVRNGICMDTSMGFTPLEGIMMGTRSGTVDPGMLIYLLRNGLNVDDLDRGLNYQSGLLGVSGISPDMRELLAAARTSPDAQLAIDMYVHRIKQTIGAMSATLGGMDCLVFTAGVGEHSPEIRARVCENMDFLGIELDRNSNENCKPDADITSARSRARVLVIATREDLTIVREARRLLSGATGSSSKLSGLARSKQYSSTEGVKNHVHSNHGTRCR
jgi:acetate kinase